MIQGSHFNLASVSRNSILTNLKSAQVSKAAGLDSLSGCFLKYWAKFLAKPVFDSWNLSINSEKLPDSCKVAKLMPFYKKDSLTLSCNYRPISLLPLIPKVMKKLFTIKQVTLWIRKTYYTICFLKKALYRFLPFLFEWQNFKGLWQEFDDWHDSNWSSKAFDKVDNDLSLQSICYWLISQNMLQIGFNLIYPTDHFWLIWEIIFLNLYLHPALYLKVLF